MSDKKKKEKSPFAGALADKLKGLDIEPAERDEAVEDNASRSSESTTSSKRQPSGRDSNPRPELDAPSASELDKGELSDEELFAKAVEELAPEDVYRGKFHGQGPEFPEENRPGTPEGRTSAAPGVSQENEGDSPEDRAAADEEARQDLDMLREMRQFEKAVGPVDKLVRNDKYRRKSSPDPKKDAERALSYRSESPDMITPALPKSGDGLNNVGPLDAAQKEMLDRYKKRSRRHDVPEINFRGDSVEDALRQLELFAHQHWKGGARFVRIIHGRGLQSDGDPVLKPAILRWLEGPGFRYVRGYVPEVNSAGDYGSLIVELERRDP
ncbi:hypothetical protein FIV42_12835 [Persicimonas caeni]|uniref:Smr domain-containing protein n=1 Tax=Persicimonas caeni TaxID=2292766 RepID=A0A4Y6PTM8_PERCE|nr:Smr/MutS family protein [Persicimonas caeni]QDG51600.1 hypothetical protein FIV42_12835 [Persicimonas caeni]QED32821.1 hypothetical protein FRD00_12830 [Persicimonas caeni]